MENAMVNSAVAVRKAVALPLVVLMSWALSFVSDEVSAGEQAVAQEQRHGPELATSLDGVSAWMKDRFSQSEMEALSDNEFRRGSARLQLRG